MTDHPSHGTIVKWDPAGGTTYVAIGQVQDISVPNISRGTIDTSTHDTDARTFLPGLTDSGDFSFSLVFDPANTAHSGGGGTGILGDFDRAGCIIPAWEVTLNVCSGTAVWTFDGFPTGFSGAAPVEGALTVDVAVKVTGRSALTVT